LNMNFILFFLIAFILFTVLYSTRSFAPWVPSRTRDLPRILKLANLKPNEIFYDLGCGNGRVVAYISKNSKAKAIGIEFSWPLYLFSKIRQLISPRKNLIIRWGNLFKADLADADVIYVFGMPDKLKDKLALKIQKETHPGTRIISYTFEIKGWEPLVIDRVQGSDKDLPIYLYVR
jgi:SAM-dependent methyltransferase